jgi:hypothetical protein
MMSFLRVPLNLQPIASKSVKNVSFKTITTPLVKNRKTSCTRMNQPLKRRDGLKKDRGGWNERGLRKRGSKERQSVISARRPFRRLL